MTKSRVSLLLLVIVVFAYLSLNVLLNFTPLRGTIVDRLERQHFHNVEISFLYLNWEFRPTVRSIILERGARDDGRRTTLELNNVALVLDWSSWWKTADWGVENSLRRAYVTSVRAEHRIPEDQKQAKEVKESTSTGPSLDSLPDLPIEVKSWTVRYRRGGSDAFKIEGQQARYQVGKEPFTTRVTRLQDDTSDIDLRVLNLDPLRTQARVKQASLPDAVWELEGDRWSGSLEYRAGDTGVLTVSLEGVPGVIQNRRLPETKLTTTVLNDEGGFRVKSFSATSDYLSLTMGGRVSPAKNTIDLDGEYSLEVKDRLNRILPDPGENHFRVSSSDTLTGNISVDGSLHGYAVSGQFRLPRTEFEFVRGDLKERVILEDFEGFLSRSGVVLTGGRVRNSLGMLRLDSGGFLLEDGEVRSEINGTLTEVYTEVGSQSDSSVIRRYLGPVGSVNVPVGFTGQITPSAFTGDFVVKDGRVNFGEGPLREIRLLVSYSTREGSPNVVRGEWIDPLDNEWSLRGRPLGPLTLSSTLNDVSPLLEKATALNFFRTEIVRSGRMNFEAEIDDPFSFGENYRARLSLGDARLGVSENPSENLNLGGVVSLNDRRLKLNDVILGDPAESGVSLNGTMRYPTRNDTGGWDLTVEVHQFDPSPFLKTGVESRTRMNFNGTVTGPPRKPRLAGSLSESFLRAYHLEVTDLTGELTVAGDRVRVDNIEANMSEGRLSGSVQHEFSGSSELDLELNEFSLPKIFPPESWMERKTHGQMNLSLELSGDFRDRKTLNGLIAGSGETVVLDHFPEVSDIRDVARPSVFERKLPVKPFEFSFPVTSGVVNVDGFILRSKEIDFKTAGTTNLDGELSLNMTLVLRGSALKRYLQDVLGNLYRQVGLQAGEKKLTIPIDLKGSIEKPVLEIQRDKVSNDFRENLLKDLLSEPIGKPVNELIEEIFLLE